MNFDAFIASVVGASLVAVVSALLSLWQAIRMKRELYREIVYREQVVAYNKVYSYAASYVHQFQYPTEGSDREGLKAIIGLALRFEQEVEKCGLFMPESVMSAVREIGEIKKQIIKGTFDITPHVGLDPGVKIPEDAAYILA
ncbi:MAG: hypothetical protein AB1427_00720 [Thermodesulfobacteriota bacterium]